MHQYIKEWDNYFNTDLPCIFNVNMSEVLKQIPLEDKLLYGSGIYGDQKSPDINAHTKNFSITIHPTLFCFEISLDQLW